MSDPTAQFTPGMNPRPVQPGEPMTSLVFDQELVGRLQALERGGFGNRAEQVIVDHLAKIGQYRAGGRTPREIKSYIWSQMQWDDGGVVPTPTGDLHSLRRSVRANTEVIDPVATRPGAAGPADPYAPADPYGQDGPYGHSSSHGQHAAALPPGTALPGEPAGGPADGHGPGPGPEDDRGGVGGRIAGEILAWIPRALLLLGIYQLVRLVPGFDRMPDVSLWTPFRVLGDGVLGLLNLDPAWSDQAANLTIPALGLLAAGFLNYLTPLRRGRRLAVWPYFLVIVAWVIVFAAGDLGGWLSDVTQGFQEDVRQGVEDEVGRQIDEQVDKTVEEQKGQLEEQLPVPSPAG
ncbi:hypothetical protein [Myceligenerans crystallogenes]|uniref:Uncharacterized protein n=1 Tax=Myceligenerans crystallogenes TaxID=316335 RepID=A0ABP4ZR97_9MICO